MNRLPGSGLELEPERPSAITTDPRQVLAADLAVGTEGVWVYDQHQGAVSRIDPSTSQVVRTIPVISQPLVELDSRVLALGDGAVWVVDKAGQALVRVDPSVPLTISCATEHLRASKWQPTAVRSCVCGFSSPSCGQRDGQA
jgi:streptogramin lyase